MRLVFIGPPGAGKGTQAERIVARYGLAHLSTGDMLRAARAAGTELGRRADQYMSAGQLVPDDLIIDLIRQRLAQPDCRAGYLLDGFPRTLAQAEALDRLLAARGTPLNVVLELQVDDEVIKARLAGRGRADDKPEVIAQRLVAYHEQTAPLVDYYRRAGLLQSVDGVGTIDEVFARVCRILDPLAG